MTFKELLENKEFVLLDGAMGTMLQKSGLKLGGIPEELNFTNPELIEQIHKKYIKAGAMAVYANTFGANRHKLADSKYSVAETVKKGIEIAKKACAGTDALVALDVGSLGVMLRPTGDLPADEAYDMFKEIMLAGRDADFIVLETMTDLMEIKTALLAAKENTDLPVVCTMTFEKNLRTFTGCTVASMALTLGGMGADVIGMNCSLGPDEAMPIVDELLKWSEVPVLIRPNAGLPDPKTNEYNVTPSEYADIMASIADKGVKVLGGCCGTSPEFIAEVAKRLDGRKFKRELPEIPAAVCSANTVVTIDTVCVIGERINPTGKKLFKEALKRRDLDYIMKQAIEQTEGGAEILDVNVGLPDIDEREMMLAAVDAVQSVTDAPLQIDTTETEVLEAALRNVSGKPIVNSVNGEDEKLEAVLPLVKKYGAAVIGLALDKDGIPKTAEKRFEIAEKILKRALEYGIPKRDVYIDCLTLTASAEQENVPETVKAIRMVRERLGLKNVLGVSNISFGLPNRELVNTTFLTMAMNSGLDLPIMNPNSAAMIGAVRAFRLLSGYDKNGAEFIEKYANAKLVTQAVGSTASAAAAPESGTDISHAIASGLKAECAAAAEKLLAEGMEPMELINEKLIPALDEAGERFEKGKIFLPQLIQSAGAAQAAFDAVKKALSERGGASESRGRVVLATVKGDVHDIGKNIVKTLLENYGFEVIDLGKDVEYQAVVDAAIKYDVRLVGLSALMTTTLKSMEGTIKLLHDNNVNCKIVVGGAVLTPEYAEKIGADFYAKDAKETVDVARRVYESLEG
ncbi:MAG: homocysteine S-methyltransferase family protein [Lachnospiraceae bacterium]|nr:homocysteine S-methyltransferase family protein [Ruminococcus sp.]MCM1275916.1 homocysteine S-methyltransferase family protein [Lachnospiraceae bacterium]